MASSPRPWAPESLFMSTLPPLSWLCGLYNEVGIRHLDGEWMPGTQV